MSFREYMRWEGWVAIAAGIGLCAYGLSQGHQGTVDALFSGAIMLTGTGVFMVVRHKVPFRAPGAWFTAKPLAAAEAPDAHCPAACRRRRLLVWMLVEVAVLSVVTVALSVLTGYWLTYVDFGVWAVAVGAIKAGPAATAIAAHEARTGTTYLVARRPVRGLVQLTADG